MRRNRLTRRTALSLLAGSALSLPSVGWGQAGSGIGGTGIDAGIGGTGIESGIGGTGIFGLIEGFSSIWVNDVKVEIPSAAHITLNGQPAGESDLTLGQTVAIEAFEAADGSLQASRIDASLALVGPIDHMDQGRGRWALSILGQKVIVSSLTDSSALGIGDWVVVTGLRDHRGHIQAANIQPTSTRDAVITGAVSSDGTVAGISVLMSEGQRLQAGTRATVQGPLLDRSPPQMFARAVSIRPLSIFDASRVGSLFLTGLPGEQDDLLFVDGYPVRLPGVSGQSDPGLYGLQGRVHGRFDLQGGKFRPRGGPAASMKPRAPFMGEGRRGHGAERPSHRGSGESLRGSDSSPHSGRAGKKGMPKRK